MDINANFNGVGVKMAVKGIAVGNMMCNNVVWSHSKALKAGLEPPSDGAHLTDDPSAADIKD